MVRTIQACDVGILAYKFREQSSSGVLALTMSCGRPVIATDFQYARGILNEQIGIVVQMGNESALTSAIESLLCDSERRKRMGEESYNFTRKWVWHEVARRYCEIIDEVNR